MTEEEITETIMMVTGSPGPAAEVGAGAETEDPRGQSVGTGTGRGGH